VLVPALQREPEHTMELLHDAFNRSFFGARLEQLRDKLRLTGPNSELPWRFVEYVAEILLAPERADHELRRLGVTRIPPFDADRLAERLVVAAVAATGANDVKTVGGWFGAAMRGDWQPKANEAVAAFAATLRRLSAEDERRRAKLTAESIRGGDQRAAPAQDPTSPRDQADCPAHLDPEVVAAHLTEAKAAFPWVADAGEKRGRDADPTWCSRLVRMYLLDRDAGLPGAATSSQEAGGPSVQRALAREAGCLPRRSAGLVV
jgi:hypothetical protein